MNDAPPRPGVLEAQGCQRAIEQDPARINGYIIRACTNTGVWLVDRTDKQGQLLATYDFVNGDYAGPETGYGLVPVESLGETEIAGYQVVRKTLNDSLKKTL